MTMKTTKTSTKSQGAKHRLRKLMHFSISPEARARLEDIAERSARPMSAVVEQLIRDAEMPRRI